MTNWNDPSLSQTWTNRDLAIKGRDESNAKMNYNADSNIPDGTIRWNTAQDRFEIWDATGGTWSTLTSLLKMSVQWLEGHLGSYYQNRANHTGSISPGTISPQGDSSGLNADLIDGRHAGTNSGNVAVSSGVKCSNLNADMVDGLHASQIQEFSSGTRLLFPQGSPPSGWTQIAHNDRVIRVVSGGGGGLGGSWTISGLSVDNHTLTVSQMPVHNHGGTTINFDVGDVGSNTNCFATGIATAGSNTGAINMANSGSGQSHTHGLTANGVWRPAYLNVVNAQKN